jgi:hypothetical protein
MMHNKEAFERIAARVLAKAEEAFPLPIALRPRELLDEEGIERDKHSLALCDHTLSWLHEEGFFRSPGPLISGSDDRMERVYAQARLRTKGLNALNATIKLAGKRERVGALPIH